jgi:hypothetical protein
MAMDSDELRLRLDVARVVYCCRCLTSQIVASGAEPQACLNCGHHVFRVSHVPAVVDVWRQMSVKDRRFLRTLRIHAGDL